MGHNKYIKYTNTYTHTQSIIFETPVLGTYCKYQSMNNADCLSVCVSAFIVHPFLDKTFWSLDLSRKTTGEKKISLRWIMSTYVRDVSTTTCSNSNKTDVGVLSNVWDTILNQYFDPILVSLSMLWVLVSWHLGVFTNQSFGFWCPKLDTLVYLAMFYTLYSHSQGPL